MENALSLGPPVLNLISAFAVGALIGAERERRKGEGPARSPAGIRTFTITSISGAVAFSIGGGILLAVLTASVAVHIRPTTLSRAACQSKVAWAPCGPEISMRGRGR